MTEKPTTIETPKEGEMIEGGWDKGCVNPFKAVATGDREPWLGVRGVVDKKRYFCFKYWRYPGDTDWRV